MKITIKTKNEKTVLKIKDGKVSIKVKEKKDKQNLSVASAPATLDTLLEISDALSKDGNISEQVSKQVGNLLHSNRPIVPVFINKDVFNYDLFSDETKEKLDKVIKELLTLPVAKLGHDAIIVCTATVKVIATDFGIHHEIIESEGFYEWCHAELNKQYVNIKDKLKYGYGFDVNLNNPKEVPNLAVAKLFNIKPSPSAYTTRSVCVDFGIDESYHNQLEALMTEVVKQYPLLQIEQPDQFNLIVNNLANKLGIGNNLFNSPLFKEWFNTRLLQEIKLNNL